MCLRIVYVYGENEEFNANILIFWIVFSIKSILIDLMCIVDMEILQFISMLSKDSIIISNAQCINQILSYRSLVT